VEARFDAEEWARMTPAQRVKLCSVLAEQCQKLADAADGKFRPQYLQLTTQWQTLAQEIEATQNTANR
jgi:hypothetical protein